MLEKLIKDLGLEGKVSEKEFLADTMFAVTALINGNGDMATERTTVFVGTGDGAYNLEFDPEPGSDVADSGKKCFLRFIPILDDVENPDPVLELEW